MKDVMVDLETLGRRAGCAILSIGAVAFDAETGKMGPEFYMVVKMASCEKHGLHTDPDTVAWWEKQNPEAQKVLKQARAARGNKDLPKALTEFNTYLAQFGPPISRSDAFAVNVDPVESDLARISPEELRDQVWREVPFVHQTTWQNLDDQPDRRIGRPSGLPKALLYALLALLFVETFLAWRFGHHDEG